MVKGDSEYWGRWNQFQETGKFPKRNRNTSFQIPDAELDRRLEANNIGTDEWGNDLPVSVIDPITKSRRGLVPKVECPSCYVRKHTPSRMAKHILENHPDNLDLPGKEDGMLF